MAQSYRGMRDHPDVTYQAFENLHKTSFTKTKNEKYPSLYRDFFQQGNETVDLTLVVAGHFQGRNYSGSENKYDFFVSSGGSMYDYQDLLKSKAMNSNEEEVNKLLEVAQTLVAWK